MRLEGKNGITIIALVITIIILLILAGITIGALTGEGGLISKANFAAFSSKIRDYQDMVETYVIKQEEQNKHGTGNINISNPDEIKNILENMEEDDLGKYVIQDNELRYNPDTVTDQEEEWLIELGILAMTSLVVISFMVNGSIYQKIEAREIIFPNVDPTSSNGNFAGWYYDQEFNKQAIEGEEISEDITLYAKFGDFVATYIVDGEVYETIEGNNLTYPQTNPSKDNVKFVGWYYDEDGTKEAKEGDALSSNTNIYPKWTSYIKNKLDGKYIYLLAYYSNTSSDWYYANNSTEISNDPLYQEVIVDGRHTIKYPAWVKLR